MARVLLVDDDEMLRRVLHAMLESSYEVVSVGTGEAALAQAESGSFVRGHRGRGCLGGRWDSR